MQNNREIHIKIPITIDLIHRIGEDILNSDFNSLEDFEIVFIPEEEEKLQSIVDAFAQKKIQDEPLKIIRNEIKEQFDSGGIGFAISELKKVLETNSESYDELILLNSNLKQINTASMRGNISYEDESIERRNVERRFMFLINNLKKHDLRNYFL